LKVKRFENFRILMLMAAIMLGLAAEAQALACGQEKLLVVAIGTGDQGQTAVF